MELSENQRQMIEERRALERRSDKIDARNYEENELYEITDKGRMHCRTGIIYIMRQL